MKIQKFPNDLTVKELKEIIKDWPEIDHMGEPTQVFIETGKNLSSPVSEIWPLNKSEESADIEFISRAFL